MPTILKNFLGYAVIAMPLGAGVAYVTHYTYTRFDSPGGRDLLANGINDSGQIVGSITIDNGRCGVGRP